MELTAEQQEALARARVRTGILHARARWLGTALLPVGIILLVAVVLGALLGHISGWNVVIGFLCCGSAVAAFGTHSDTALALLKDHRGHRDIPPALAHELDGEFLFRRLALSEAQATPGTAWIMTAVAVLAPLWCVWRLLAG